jgi:Tol biopolymer transport system component
MADAEREALMTMRHRTLALVGRIGRTSKEPRVKYLVLAALCVMTSGVLASLPAGSYLGQTPPGDSPEVFAPRLVSLDTRLETYPTFSPDLKTIFLSVVNADWSQGRLLATRLENGAWTSLEPAAFSDGRSIDWESSISPDGKRMFFASSRPPSSGMDIWMVERTADTSWSAPVHLPAPINSAADDGSPCVTNNGTLYFKSVRGGGVGGSWLYRAALTNGAYRTIESLGAIVRTTAGESEPYVAPDESYLIFISQTRTGGIGGWDLWICFRGKDGSWSVPANLGPEVNSADDEYGPRVTPDGRYLFFTRERRGRTMDIYWVSARVIDRLRANAQSRATAIPEPAPFGRLRSGCGPRAC